MLKPGFVADNRRIARQARRATPGDARPSSASSTPTATSTTPPRCAPTATCRRHVSQAAAAELRRVRRGPLLHARYRQRSARAVRDRRRQGRHPHLRGHLEPVRSARRAGRRRRRAEHQHQRLAVPLRARAPAASGCSRPGPPTRARAIVYVNQVGGQDELVFDGGSMVFDAEGKLLARAAAVRRGADDRRRADPAGLPQAPARPAWSAHRGRAAAGARERRQPVDTPTPLGRHRSPRRSSPIDELYEALVLGTRDYARKNGFTDVVIGLSGGIDSTHRRRASPSTRSAPSTCTACRCRRATPATIRSPTPQTARRQPRHRLPHDLDRAGVPGLPRHARAVVRRAASRTSPTRTCRAACRGQLLMALSNKFGWMVLTTGNKSEMAVGYFTIYGDSVGGYAVIKDVLKTRVYDLCRYVNRAAGREVIPRGRHHQAAVGRAAPRPARRPEPAAVRGARPDPRAVRRGRPHRRRDHRARPRRGDRAPDHPPRRHHRVQAPPVPARRAGERRRRSARTAACRSPTATAADARRTCGRDVVDTHRNLSI